MAQPHEQHPNQSQRRPLEEGLGEVRILLGDLADIVLPQDRVVTGLSRENFQSSTFQRAGYSFMRERYSGSDRSLSIITFADGAQTFVVGGKISSGNPYEVGHASGDGIDLRKTITVIYDYDGIETITERTPDGEINTYHGEYGKPEALLPHVRRSMGTLVSREEFGHDPTIEEHPLLSQGLPDWLANVPMDAPKPTWIPVGEGKSASLGMLVKALQSEIGVTIGSFAIAPELAKLFAEQTENNAWMNLPSEPTSVERIDEDTLQVKVGDFRKSFNRDELLQRIRETLDETPKE